MPTAALRPSHREVRMRLTSAHHRLPRAGLDPIRTAPAALHIVSMAVHRPLRPETVAVMLDDARRGFALVVVSGTHQPDDVVEVVEYLTDPSVHGDRLGAMIVAAVRPPEVDRAVDPSDRRAHEHADIDRWLEMSDLAEQAGVELVEWFVIGRDVSCPRDRLGEPPRWPPCDAERATT